MMTECEQALIKERDMWIAKAIELQHKCDFATEHFQLLAVLIESEVRDD